MSFYPAAQAMRLYSPRTLHTCCRLLRSERCHAAPRATTAILGQPTPQLQFRRWRADAATSSSQKVTGIVDQISQLTLLETADLVSALKVSQEFRPTQWTSSQFINITLIVLETRLNIPDVATRDFAPVTPAAPAAAVAEEEEAPPAAQEKTLFNLKLQSFDAAAKPKVIKEIKSMLGLSLVDSKRFVESAPKMIKEGVPKDDGQKIVDTMKTLGAVVIME